MMMRNKKNRLLFILFTLWGFLPLFAQHLVKEIHFYKHSFLPCYEIKKLNHPEFFQGNNKKQNYFEGWYFKLVAADKSAILSIIPGISLSDNGKEQHAFIQIIDGKTAQTFYYSYPIEAFSFSKKEFAIQIDSNYFSSEKITLNIHTDSSSIKGEIQITNSIKLNTTEFLNPGIMGWYRYVPLMECYHGVVSLSMQLQGMLVNDMREYNFNQGRGYIEKDWGSSMPSAWIWMQSNHFSKGNSSFMLSVANIPWMGKSFTGFLGFFLHNNELYRFATYTRAKLIIEKAGINTSKITIKDKKYTYLIEASHKQSGILKAPEKGSMDRRIPESLDARLLLTVLDKKGNVIFCDSSSIAGLEMVGDQKTLCKSLKKK